MGPTEELDVILLWNEEATKNRAHKGARALIFFSKRDSKIEFNKKGPQGNYGPYSL